jgi:hypothetical protein
MGFEVLVENLRSASARYRTTASSLGTGGVEITHVEPGSFGHIELAAWVKTIAEQCDLATRALHDGATELADGLDTAAHHYETTDVTVGQVFQSPLSSGLLGPTSPFATGPTP